MTDIEKLMLTKAKNALKFAYAPYSNYSVACCICTEDNTLYTGVNVENSSYGLTSCAETSAICQMISAGKQQIKHVLVLAKDKALCTPCGACRQRIFEFSTPQTSIHLCINEEIYKTMTMNDLLPMAFTLNTFGTKK